MALRGTLKDFGIAEIFQLIGGQGKSGTLTLESKKGKIKLLFDKGAIVGVDFGGREARGSLADLLLRAELVTASQIKEALAIQKKTLRRLPDIVLEQGWVKADVLEEMVALETNEALYGLFAWQDGTYRFEAGDVEYDRATVRPRSLEHLLMEGFRRVDEWPIIWRRIGSHDASFEVVAPLPEQDVEGEIGHAERRVFSLISPGRDVTKLIDLSRLGEFETCRALQHLLDLGYIRVAERGKAKRRRDRKAAGIAGAGPSIGLEFIAKGLLSLVAIGLLFVLVGYAKPDLSGLLRAPASLTLGATDPRALLGSGQIERLREALEVYRLEKGGYPDRLEQLVEAGLVAAAELGYPWERSYHYERGEPYRLHPPVR
jgi:hypothetical protein